MENNLNYAHVVIQPEIDLTTSYVSAETTIQNGLDGVGQIADNNQLILLVDLVLGAGASCQLVIQGSHDGTTWYQESVADVTAGTQTVTQPPYQFAESGNYPIPMQIRYNKVRVQFKRTGGSAGESNIQLAAIIAVS